MAFTCLFMLAQFSSRYQTFIYVSFPWDIFHEILHVEKNYSYRKLGGNFALLNAIVLMKIYLTRFIFICLTLNELKQFSEKFFFFFCLESFSIDRDLFATTIKLLIAIFHFSL